MPRKNLYEDDENGPDGDDPEEVRQWTVPDTISSLVRAAAQDEAAARNEIATIYREPVMEWLRGHGCEEGLVEDVTQDFLAYLTAEKKGALRHFDPQRGKLRVFLEVSVRNFLSNEQRKWKATKRGGMVPHLSLETLSLLREDLAEKEGEEIGTVFDLPWARALYGNVIRRMEAEWCEDPAREKIYRVLQPYITPQAAGPDYAVLSGELGQRETTLRKNLSRLRRQFREAWLGEVRRIVTDPAEVAAEARAMLVLLYKVDFSRDAGGEAQ